METYLHLQISQHQASSKHENFTLSYHSYTSLLPQNILQLQLHFGCTLYSINNLRFTKIRVSWNGELPLYVPNYKMFLTLPKFEWSCFSWPNFDLGCCNLLKYLWYTQIWMTLFQFDQIFLIVHKFEWSCFNYTNMIKAVGAFAQMFLNARKFKWSGCILFKLEWSCLKFPEIEKAVWSSPKMNKAVWSSPKLNKYVPLGPNLNGAIVVWPELI